MIWITFIITSVYTHTQHTHCIENERINLLRNILCEMIRISSRAHDWKGFRATRIVLTRQAMNYREFVVKASRITQSSPRDRNPVLRAR